MSIASTNRKAGPYTGNGVTTIFPFTFKVFTASDLLVVRADTSALESTLALTTDYTVTLNSNQDSNPGGTVTLVSALATGYTVTISSQVPQKQPVVLTNMGGFYPSVINDALDRLTIFAQELGEKVSRAVTLPISVAGASADLPAPEANKFLAWNPTATELQNVDSSGLASIIAFGTAKADIFSGNASSTVFTLTANPGALNNLDVSISGVTQKPSIDYTWSSGTTLTFTTAPASGTNNVLVRYLQGLPQGYTDSAASSYLQNGVGTITRFVRDCLREKISVKDFGAVGDGITDDTLAIQKAISHASTFSATIFSGGCVVEFPNGIYKVTSSLYVSNSTTTPIHNIIFKGDEATIYDSVGVAGVFVVGDSTETIALTIYNISFVGLKFYSTAILSTSSVVLKFYRCANGFIDDCTFAGFYRGIEGYGLFGYNITRNWFVAANRTSTAIAALTAAKADVHILLDGQNARTSGSNRISHNEFWGGGSDTVSTYRAGISVKSADTVYIHDNHLYQGDYGLVIEPTGSSVRTNNNITDILCTNNYFDFTAISNVLITGTMPTTPAIDGFYQNIRFTGCYFRDSGRGVDVSISDGTLGKSFKGLTFTGCSFKSQDSHAIRVLGASNVTPKHSISGLSITGCDFADTNGLNASAEVIFADCESATITGNSFEQPSNPVMFGLQLTLKSESISDADSAVITGNNFMLLNPSVDAVRITASGVANYSQSGNIIPAIGSETPVFGSSVKDVYRGFTTDATTSQMVSKYIPNGWAGIAVIKVIGKARTGTGTLIYHAIQGFDRTTGGVLAMSGTLVTPFATVNTAPLATLPAFSVTSNFLAVNVTGAAGVTYDWICDIDLIMTGQYSAT